MHDLYPSKEALDAAIASGSARGFSETFEQLDELLITLGTRWDGHEGALDGEAHLEHEPVVGRLR